VIGVKKLQNREEELFQEVLKGKLPEHVAIIMDGNGRWAQKRGLPRLAGHRAGIISLKKVVACAQELGIKVITLYAFSTENWKRPRREVDFLMRLPGEYLQKELGSLIEKNIIIKIMGDLNGVPEFTQKAIKQAVEATQQNTGMVLNFAFNYGGRTEIVNTVKRIAKDVFEGRLRWNEITEKVFANYLDTGFLPDPDLLIRPSGELRISNFLLWQLAYTELWFTKVMWPDFNKMYFLKAIKDYQKRERRFGGI
jgi:undecaprenyl diphosphate synthase